MIIALPWLSQIMGDRSHCRQPAGRAHLSNHPPNLFVVERAAALAYAAHRRGRHRQIAAHGCTSGTPRQRTAHAPALFLLAAARGQAAKQLAGQARRSQICLNNLKGDHDQSQPTPPAVCGLPRRRGAALLEILNFRRPFKVPGHPDGHGQKRTLSGSVRPGGHGQNLEGCPSLSGLCPVPFSYL